LTTNLKKVVDDRAFAAWRDNLLKLTDSPESARVWRERRYRFDRRTACEEPAPKNRHLRDRALPLMFVPSQMPKVFLG
jgi:hypothetical protein